MKNFLSRDKTNELLGGTNWWHNLINHAKKIFTKKKMKNFFLGSTTKKIFWIYLIILFIGSILLFLPISFNAFELEGFNGSIYNFKTSGAGYSFNYWPPGEIYHTPNQIGGEGKSIVFHFSFLDSLFTAFSSFSDTGLGMGATSQIFSTFGKLVMMFLIQVGGFGIMFFVFYIWKILEFVGKKNKITINQALLAQAERGNTKIGNTPRMLTITSLCILSLQFVYAIFYSLWFMYVPAFQQITDVANPNGFLISSDLYTPLYQNSNNAFFAGFFHSVSSVNNAGFDIIGSNSMAPYRNGVHSILLLVTISEFVIGGIGFPVIYDLLSKYKIVVIRKWNKWDRRYFSFRIRRDRSHRRSLLTKVSIVTYIFVAIFAIVGCFIFECTSIGAGNNQLWNSTSEAFGAPGSSISYYNKSVQIIFQSFSTRSAGYSTFNLSNLNPATKWFMTFLMFVGGSPSSTAGGIRTTTLAVILITIYSKLIGRVRPRAFRRSFQRDDIVNAFVVGFSGLFIVSIGGIIIVSSLSSNSGNNTDFSQSDSFTNAMFITSSAFGTTGLSTNDIKNLDWYAKLYLMFLMFIGQYGLSSTLLSIKKNKLNKNSFQYISEEIKIG